MKGFLSYNYMYSYNNNPFLPPALAVQVIKTEPSVCVCVCLLALSRLNRLAYGHEIWHKD